jgi:hypothetical protein
VSPEGPVPPPDPNAAAAAIFQLFQQWLTRVEGKIDTLTGRLEGKADRAEVSALAERLETKATKDDLAELRARVERESERIERESERTDGLEKHAELHIQRDTDRTEWRRWAVPLALTLALLAVGVVQVVLMVRP